MHAILLARGVEQGVVDQELKSLYYKLPLGTPLTTPML
jgi:hypothetical protein